MKLVITHADASSNVVLDVSVAGQYFAELEPGKSITIAGPQVAISFGRLLEDNHEDLAA